MRYIIPALIAIRSFQFCYANGSNDNSYDLNNADAQWEEYNGQNYAQEDDDVEHDWYLNFDDPYLPTDDAVVAEMKASLKTYRKVQQRINEERREETIRMLAAGSYALFGLILGTFCTTGSLYYAKKTALMMRYENEGIAVDANILASEPKIRNTEQEKSPTVAIEMLPNKSSDGDAEQAIHDNYSMLSDDDDTNFASFSLGPNSSSKDSSSSSESVAAPDDDSQQQPGDNDMKNVTTSPNLSNRNISVGRNQRKDFESVWKTIDQQHIPSTQRFVVVVEYKHPQFISRVRKRLLVMGNDIKLSEADEMSNNKVLLYVLNGCPKSGQCCGEIRRALKWNVQFSFFFLLSFNIVLTTVTVVAASKLLSQDLFVAYLVVLLLLMSLEVLFLDSVFANIVAKQHLDYGRDLPVVTTMKNASFEKKDLEMTLKHGASFA